MRDTSKLDSVKYSRRVMEYTINARLLKRYKNKGCDICALDRCNEPIKVGDRIVRQYNGRSSTRLFHVKCAEELNII